ncbi:hypothetical protein CU311_06745 [Prochlorococcus marinus str. MU1402]|nr:hypothetical protein [Prochlorococcus marinus str. MU1402]
MRYLNQDITFKAFDRLSSIRLLIKINVFRSPMSELISLQYSINHLIAKIIFKVKNRKFNLNKNQYAKKFNQVGFACFTDKNIENECKSILQKLNSEDEPWDSENRFNRSASKAFKKELINIFNSGVNEFIQSAFDSDYYIFYHTLYKSNRLSKAKIPEGSQLWHADGGPGNCMNLMICHSHINEFNGSMKIFPWEISKKLLGNLSYGYKRLIRSDLNKIKNFDHSRMAYRELKCNLLAKYIKKNAYKFFQPKSKTSGTIFAFRNNCVHAGGFTEVGNERIVSIFHIYPSKKQTSIEEKFESLHLKNKALPAPKELP